MKIEEINIEGKNVGFKNLSDDIFSLKPRKDIIQSVLDWQKNRMFKKTGHTKSRSEVKAVSVSVLVLRVENIPTV